jgi:hypothetical protein
MTYSWLVIIHFPQYSIDYYKMTWRGRFSQKELHLVNQNGLLPRWTHLITKVKPRWAWLVLGWMNKSQMTSPTDSVGRCPRLLGPERRVEGIKRSSKYVWNIMNTSKRIIPYVSHTECKFKTKKIYLVLMRFSAAFQNLLDKERNFPTWDLHIIT